MIIYLMLLIKRSCALCSTGSQRIWADGIDRYLPSAESEPKDYADLKKKMLAIYQAMPTTEKYVVDDFQMKKISVDNLTWNAVGFLKDGLIVNDTKHNYSQGVFLSDYIYNLI